ncbi:hypothetical protein DSM104443_01929 [Usitatibacter rugosus]|uniref:DUF4872 domain-containing protein n=2 Tax=Usitatibacter rugosus TaxID=2732067 RepID=A0A6M4GU44_9PROT|nr:hypothetical protein DSM104443_01929 [Usitatibacter rugosus]
MVFGLGSGLGFVYTDDGRYSPVHRFNGRALDLEGKFYRLFGHELAWMGRWDPQAITASLAAGRPLLAQTDIAYLPYYEPVHFPMHGIVVTDFDGTTATIADTFSHELQRVPAEALRAALVGEGCPWMEPYRIASAPKIDFRVDAALIARSIAITAREMLEPSHADAGIPAMKRLAARGKAWSDSPDWAWSARFAYQSIEKRGTGGGGFRGLYADFLQQVSPALPGLAAIEAVPRMRALAADWSSLAGDCKSAFVHNDPGRLRAAAQALDKIADLEAALLLDLGARAAEAPPFGR